MAGIRFVGIDRPESLSILSDSIGMTDDMAMSASLRIGAPTHVQEEQ